MMLLITIPPYSQISFNEHRNKLKSFGTRGLGFFMPIGRSYPSERILERQLF